MSVLKNLSMTSGVFLVVFVLGAISAQNEDLKLPPESDLESMEEIQELLRTVQLLFEKQVASKVGQMTVPDEEQDAENGVAVDEEDLENDVAVDEKDAENGVALNEEDVENDVEVDGNGCWCNRYGCSCCKYIRRGPRRLRKRCCLRVTTPRCHVGIRFRLTFGRRTLFTRKLYARNPLAICTAIPEVKKGYELCIKFNHLSYRGRRVSGCSKLMFRYCASTFLRVNLGCFRFSFLNATQQIGEAEDPYFDEPQAKVEGPEPHYLGEVQMNNIKPGDNEEN